MDAQTALTQTHNLKVFGLFAKVICLSDADSKNGRYFFHGIGSFDWLFIVHEETSFVNPLLIGKLDKPCFCYMPANQNHGKMSRRYTNLEQMHAFAGRIRCSIEKQCKYLTYSFSCIALVRMRSPVQIRSSAPAKAPLRDNSQGCFSMYF